MHLLLYGIHLWANLDSDRRMGGSRPNQNNYVFVIHVTHPSPIQRRRIAAISVCGKPSKWRWGRVLSWKIPQFYSVGGARCKTAFFAFLGYPSTVLRTAYRKQFYPKPVTPMESRDSEGVPFASLGVCDHAFGIYRPLNGAEKWSPDHHENLKNAYRHT